MVNSKPNILIIHTDSHRWDCMGAYGNRDIKTPYLDALASDSVTYNECFTVYPVCTPSRYSFLTGLYPNQHAGTGNRSTISHTLDTFPRILNDSGYKTAAVGKMHFTPAYLDVGFQKMCLAEQDGPGRHDDDYHSYLMEEDLADCLDLIDQVSEYRTKGPKEYHESFSTWPSDLDDDHYSTTWIGRKAVEVLADWTGHGNLLMVGFIKPHHPFDVPAPWGDLYDPSGISVLPGWLDECLECDLDKNKGYYPHNDLTLELLKKIMTQYYGSITQIDHYIGLMIKVLKDKGIYDNTLIVYTSDHGEYMGFHHLILKAGYMYDPVMRVPLLIKYPGQERKGGISDALISNIDVAPTILRQCGLTPAKHMKGLDLTEPNASREVVFGMAGADYMVRSKNLKLLYTRNGNSSFFDLSADPYELDNLMTSSKYQQEIACFKDHLLTWALGDNVMPAAADYSAPVIRKSDEVLHRASEEYFRKRVTDYLG